MEDYVWMINCMKVRFNNLAQKCCIFSRAEACTHVETEWDFFNQLVDTISNSQLCYMKDNLYMYLINLMGYQLLLSMINIII